MCYDLPKRLNGLGKYDKKKVREDEDVTHRRSGGVSMKKNDHCLLWGLVLVVVCICLANGCGPDCLNEKEPSEDTITTLSSEMDVPVETSISQEQESESSVMEAGSALPVYSEKTYPYQVDELGVTLNVPEDLFVYRTKSVRQNSDGSWFPLECTEWILVTDREYDPEYLSAGFMENLEAEAKHLVFGLTLTPKQLAPLALLFPNVLTKDVVRVTDLWYCEIMLVHTWIIKSQDGGASKMASEYCSRWSETDLPVQLYAPIWKETQGIADLNVEGDYLLAPNFTEEDPYQNTMLNSAWWSGYENAIKALTLDPDRYAYDDAQVTMVLDQVDQMCQRQSLYWYEGREMIRVYADQQSDIYLRAYYYANSVAYSQGNEDAVRPLEDIIVVFQEWNDSQRSYVVYFADDGYTYSMSDHMVDLQPSYQYLIDHNLLSTE